jgi:hypothetical protein
MKYTKLFLIFPVFVAVFCAGCNKNIGIYGKVSFPDGKPLDLGMVCFQGDRFVYRGMIQADGTFKMSSTKQNDGVVSGTYKVFITGAAKGKPLPPNVKFDADGAPPDEPPISMIDEKFTNPATSGITCTVSGRMALPFEIKVEYPAQ